MKLMASQTDDVSLSEPWRWRRDRSLRCCDLAVANKCDTTEQIELNRLVLFLLLYFNWESFLCIILAVLSGERSWSLFLVKALTSPCLLNKRFFYLGDLGKQSLFDIHLYGIGASSKPTKWHHNHHISITMEMSQNACNTALWGLPFCKIIALFRLCLLN